MLYYKAIQVRTAKDALFSNLPSLAAIKKQMIAFNPQEGELKTKAFITLILTDLVMSFNIGKTMTVPQIGQTVEFILSDYYFLKPSELKYCFDNAKKGRYGQLYDRIDSSIIFEWIENYLIERTEISISENTEKSKMIKLNGSEETNIIENLMTDSRFVANKERTIKSDTNTPKEEINRRNQTENEILIQDILREFDKIHRDLDFEITSTQSIRMIPYNGKTLTQDKFLEIRLEEMNLL